MTDLLVGLAFTIGTFFTLLLLYFVYFFQDRRNGLTSVLYRYIIIESIVVIVSELISSFLLYDKFSPTIGVILLKFHWFTGILYFYLFYFYVSAHFNNIQDVSVKDYLFKNKEGKIIGIITIIITIAFFVTPFKNLDYHALSYIPGLPAYIMFGYGVIIISITFVKYLMKKEKTKNQTRIMFLFLIASSILVIIQLKWQNIAFSPSLMAFLLLGSYFLLENPDLYVTKELEQSKNQLEYLSTHKKSEISKKAQKLTNAIFNISQANYNNINENNVELSKTNLNNNIDSLSGIVNDMQNVLNLLIIDEDKTKIDESEYDTSTLLTKLYNYSIKKIGNKNLKIEFDIDQFLPISLYGDENIIYQALLNTLDSSINNTLVGKIIFKIKCTFSNNQVLLNIDIIDTSNGLKEEDIETINNGEINLNDMQNIEGYSISKKYVSYLNGIYNISSTIGVGTTVSISFSQRIANQSKTGEFKPIEINYNLNIANRKILIVDNNSNDLIHILKKYNAIYDVANSFEECINKLKLDDSITTIFLNPSINLTNENMATSLKNIMIEQTNIPKRLIAISSNSITGTKKKYLAQGYDYFITKPYNEYDFNNIMKHI